MPAIQKFSNRNIAELLRKVSAAYQILDENRFKIIAYDRAADSIDHLTSELTDLWSNHKVEDVPGIGKGIAVNIDELLRTGKSRHFDDVLGQVPAAVFPLLSVPGFGPKKAFKLVTHFSLPDPDTVIDDLISKGEHHEIAVIEGFGKKSEELIVDNLRSYKKGRMKKKRLLLADAIRISDEISAHLRQIPEVRDVKTLGSLRRSVATIGDIDLAVATDDPQVVIKHFQAFPHEKVIETGPTGTSVLLHQGVQVDLRVSEPKRFGAMLQYFTGSKFHNIALRDYALKHGASLSEYGIKVTDPKKFRTIGIGHGIPTVPKDVQTGGTILECSTEDQFYRTLGLAYIPPEIREETGEIELARQDRLPNLVSASDIRGDLHIHTNFDLETSHDLGANSLSEILNQASVLGYEYIGLSDHNPSQSKHSENQIIEIMKRRKEYFEQEYTTWEKIAQKNEFNKAVKPKLFIMCEVDIRPDGSLAFPPPAFEYVDAVIVSIHSSFRQTKPEVTDRIIRALTSHPKVRIFGHPTGRLLESREGVDADWRRVYETCIEREIALEINSHPARLDFPDHLVREAIRSGICLVIDTDSHAVEQMTSIPFGISVARRGWAEKHDIVNTMPYQDFRKWLLITET